MGTLLVQDYSRVLVWDMGVVSQVCSFLGCCVVWALDEIAG